MDLIIPSFITNIITDSRTPVTDYSKTAFFALKTKLDDGHSYIQILYDKGVRVFVVNHLPEDAKAAMPDANFIVVDDVSEALAQSASAWRSMFTCPVIGVTGSVGKTVFKEMLNAALGHETRVTRSPRSWNSQIGVPLSVRRMKPDTELGIFEAGISRPGEMERLEKIIQPTVGVFTALTDEHASGFSSIQEKAHEKALLFKNCRCVYYPESDQRIKEALSETAPGVELIGVNGTLADMTAKVAEDLGCDPDKAKASISGAEKLSGRIDLSEITELTSVAYDHYTCDLDGIATGLDFARRQMNGHRRLIAVIGKPDCFPADRQTTDAKLQEILRAASVERVIMTDNADEAMSQLSRKETADSLIYINTADKTASAKLRDRLCATSHITRMNINLEALRSNFKYYKSLLPSGTKTVAMIKASAYGCGAVEVARTLQGAGADYFAVAVVDEGSALRAAGVDTPVIILDPWCTDPQAIATNRLEPTLIAPNAELIRSLYEAARETGLETFKVHVKLDTGMHRVGLSEDQIEEFAALLAQYPRLQAVSTFSHLATADCLDQDDYTMFQLDNFDRMSAKLEEALSRHTGKKVHLLRHILNTAGTQRFADKRKYDMVRLGIGLYGISPLEPNPNLQAVASLVTTIIALSPHKKGETIGYGRRGVLSRDSMIATLPIGYADGINRHLGNGNGRFLINGMLCPTVGNICMDQCMVDVTDLAVVSDPGHESAAERGVHVGSSVEIFGTSAPIEHIADVLDTIPYEILTSVSPRVHRVYFRE